MKIGIFDSGLGGLIIAKAIRKHMPAYDYVYLGDTKRVPYGNRSHETVYEFTKQGIEYLFTKEKCSLVILACNTASARALRRIQKEYLPKYSPNKKVLGVLIPSAEEGSMYKKVGVIATRGTVASETFPKEIRKISKNTKVVQNSAPMLVPIIEEGEYKLAKLFLEKYLEPFKNVDALILGCTHYPILKKEIRKSLPKSVRIISQDEIIPKKLKEYLRNHTEIENKLSKNKTTKILVTDITQNVSLLARKWFGNTKPKLITLK
ncbi:MAG: Glutamate racemase [Patescibacteria group bacterium]|jgi:glutamate racemase|nr:Glutamate racemase [Patescibacteria group bacterium]